MSIFQRWMSGSDIVGLDLGASALKVVQLAPANKSFHLKKMGYLTLPEGTLVEGDIIDALTLEGAIRELFEKEKIHAKSVAFAVNGDAVFSKKISLSAISEEELTEQLPIIAEQYFPIPVEDLNLDYQRLEEDSPKAQTLNFMLIGVKKKFLNTFTSVIEGADLKPVAVDTFPSSLSSLTEYLTLPHPSTTIIHIGSYFTHVVMFENNRYHFHHEFAFGGKQITDLLSEKLHLSFQEAETLKISSYQEKNLPENTKEIIELGLQPLFENLRQSFNLYLNEFSGAEVQKILLSGGCAKIQPLLEWVAGRFGCEVDLLNPLKGLHINENEFNMDFLRTSAPIFSVALGLATRSRS